MAMFRPCQAEPKIGKVAAIAQPIWIIGRPVIPRPDKARPDQARPVQISLVLVTPSAAYILSPWQGIGQTRPDQAMSYQAKPDQARPGQTKSNQISPVNAKANRVR